MERVEVDRLARFGFKGGDDVILVVLYLLHQPWLRQVIDAEFRGGHALLTADLNNDGQDEILAGFRSEPYGLHAYRYLRDTGLWERTSLNASRVAVSGLIVEDFTGDGFKDVVAIGSASANLVLFVNEGR